jgi:hypothetical protein
MKFEMRLPRLVFQCQFQCISVPADSLKLASLKVARTLRFDRECGRQKGGKGRKVKVPRG